MAATPEWRLRDRLEAEGAYTTAAIERRLRAIAVERNIPADELPQALRNVRRYATPDMNIFMQRYGISCDWLFLGDLKALRAMAKPQPEPTAEQIHAAMRLLTPRDRFVLYRTIRAKAAGITGMGDRGNDPRSDYDQHAPRHRRARNGVARSENRDQALKEKARSGRRLPGRAEVIGLVPPI
jgi:hypothetical protein